ncbi:3-hydroxybutyryl-CoA dehydrogenase [Aromatoleum evansii]|uniref:3-hydroxybutyryl-CoA dehydrogenase n=1 Tax=Aromatoleum evansii TaxID=59406 RepID=A0ABZ1AL32_AROEV|nr:3-hydroxybutyryl-CoA dehydrogenase [Aromatoleum evansii]
MGIRNVGIVGAGTMGSGIAQVCAAAGFRVTLLDVSAEAVSKGVETVSRNLERLVVKEKLAAGDKATILERVSPTTSNGDLAASDLVIEAATENETLKQRILRDIDAIVSPTAIIATNTSSISVTRLAAVTGRAPQFIGMHFFNPVPVMALVELIRGLQTSDETLATARGFVEALGKTAVVARNSPGFAVNRILCPMINEAIFALHEGLASAEEIDAGMMLGCNHPIGPLALADLIGLDTMLSVMEVFYDGFKDPKYRPAPLLKEMVDAGFLGRKSGRGFFNYA